MALNLFQLNKKKTAIVNEDAAKLCPEFTKVDAKEFLLVILYCDYASPYNQLPDKERMMRAKRHVYGTADCEPETQKSVMDAMDAYMSLQYDPLREQLANCREKIIMISREMLAEKDYRLLGKMDEAQETLQKRVDKIEEKLKEVAMQDKPILKGDQRMSFIEEWHARKREWDRTHQREAAI